ncbi:head-tail joining protein [Puniceibacterium confluentis]|uniref:head-tail joining protein n=1 Tax=Puniceibacterium confluentis TaxID=1958944 RepID=UPI0011B42644|nr:hypothetical protein [Puniceibacterium confluentis]
MADPFVRAVDAAFGRLGIDGILDPEGAALAVRLLPILPDDTVEFGKLTLQSETVQYEIRRSELGAYGKGAVIEVAGDRRRIQALPRSGDARRLKATLNTVAV